MPVDVGEGQLGTGVWSFLPQDHPAPGGPCRQVQQFRWPRRPRRRPGWCRRLSSGTTRRPGMPAGGVGKQRRRCVEPRIDREPEGEPDPDPAHLRERVGGPGGIRSGQQPRTVRVARSWPGRLRQRRQRHIQHRDVIGGGVRPGVAGAEHPGQRLPGGDLGPVQETQQRVKPEGVLPGRRRVFLLAVRDADRGIEVQPQLARQVRSRPGRPRRGSGLRPGRAHPRPDARRRCGPAPATWSASRPPARTARCGRPAPRSR